MAARRPRRRARALVGSRPALALGRGLVRALGATLRVREIRSAAGDAFWRERRPVIYAVWHGRILLLPYLYGRRGVHVLASRSRDGELLSRFVQGFGVAVVRGSSSRGGGRALLALARLVRERRVEALLVPDGPRGPREVAQPGAVLLARLTGAPLVPVGVGAWPRWVLRSWDAFVVPRPFGRAAVVFGEPICVPVDADRTGIEAKREELETALRRVTAAADRAAGVPDVPAV
ncbi:MAG TPA: lysophospholipid acyltransferase family protein [Methylomirabilota bacterium]|nr:lysophospholipid acyltransferase family protein [Methylomirabilota bacterium]